MKTALISLVTACWVFGAGTVHAAAPELPAFEVNDRLDPTDPLPERETRWNNADVSLTSVTYATLPGYRPLRLDLYRQSGSTAPRPLVVFLHGGGWTFGNPRAGAAFKRFPDVLAALAARGYVVAAIEYRLSREARFPAQSEDVAAALNYLRGNSGRLGIDPARIALWGMSSGAHLAALNALECGAAPCVQGVAGWFGAYDLGAHFAATRNESLGRVMLGCVDAPCSPAALADASPIAHVAAGAPPMLLLHGAADTSVLPLQSQTFAERMQAAGNRVELRLLPDVNHGFVGADAAATKNALRQALAVTFDFFDRVLRPPPAR